MEIHHQLLELLILKKSLLSTSDASPNNYKELLDEGASYELLHEITRWEEVLSSENSTLLDLQNAFKSACRQREENQHTHLGFTVNPETVCNEWYWEMATILFAPQHLGEMLSLLMPSLRGFISWQLAEELSPVADEKESLRERVTLLIQESPLSELKSYAPTRKMLTEMVLGDSVVLILDSIRKWPFFMRQKLHPLLENYPTLQKNLYQHNEEFRLLAFHLKQATMTPYQAITQLRDELIRGGTNYTNEKFAAHFIIHACAQFRNYIDNLPNELSTSLLQLSAPSSSHLTLAVVLAHLNTPGFCVQTAALELQDIIDNEQNTRLLTQQPYLQISQLQEIKRYYAKSTINSVGYEPSSTLPQQISHALYGRIVISSIANFIDFLLNFPPEKYGELLSSAEITLKPVLTIKLNNLIREFPPAQKQAFCMAILKNVTKMGGYFDVLVFAIHLGELVFLHSILEQMAQDDKQKIINEHRSQPIIFAAASQDPNIFQLILDMYPKPEHLSLLQEETHHQSAFCQAVQNDNPAVFQKIASLFLPPQRLTLIQSTDALETAAQHTSPYVLGEMIHDYPQEEWLEFILGEQGQDVLYHALNNRNPEIFFILLNSIPAAKQLQAVDRHYLQQQTPFIFFALHNPFVFETLLNLFPKTQRPAVFRKEECYKTELIEAAAIGGSLELFNVIKRNCPQEEDFLQLIAKGTKEYSLLGLAAMNRNNEASKIVQFLLSSYPSEEQTLRLTEPYSSNQSVTTALVELARHGNDFDFLAYLIEKINPAAPARLVIDLGPGGSSILHAAAENIKNPHILSALITRYYPDPATHYALLTTQNTLGNATIHCCIIHANYGALARLFDLLDSSLVLALIKNKMLDGKTIFHQVVLDETNSTLQWQLELAILVGIIRAKFPQIPLFNFLSETGRNGNTLLHSIILSKAPAFWIHVQFILDLMPPKDQLDFIRMKNDNDESWLELLIKKHHYYTPYFKATFIMLLSIYPQEERLALLQEKCANKSKTLWQLMEGNHFIKPLDMLTGLLSSEDIAKLEQSKPQSELIHYSVFNHVQSSMAPSSEEETPTYQHH